MDDFDCPLVVLGPPYPPSPTNKYSDIYSKINTYIHLNN